MKHSSAERWLRSLVVVMAISAGAVHAQQAPPELALTARTVGVLVLTGHQIELVRIGMTVFGNKRVTVSTPDSSLTDTVFEAIESELRHERRYEVTRVPIDSARLAHAASQLSKGEQGLFGPDISPIAEDLTSAASRCGCDALLVVGGSRMAASPNSNQQLPAFSWHAASINGHVHSTDLAAPLRVFLVDARSMKLVAHAAGHQTMMDPAIDLVSPAPSLWPDDMSAVPTRAWPVVRHGLQALVRASLKWPLYRLGMRPSCAARYFENDYPKALRQGPTADQVPSEPRFREGSDPAWCT